MDRVFPGRGDRKATLGSPPIGPGSYPGTAAETHPSAVPESLMVLRRRLAFGPFQRCDDVSFIGKCLLFGRGKFVVGVGRDGHGNVTRHPSSRDVSGYLRLTSLSSHSQGSEIQPMSPKPSADDGPSSN
jgi:hypothetical protein